MQNQNNKALHHLHIMVTRPEPQGLELCKLIEAHGGHASYFPTIVFAPSPDRAAFQAAIKVLGEQDYLVFLSPQAVYASAYALHEMWPEFPPTVKIAAIGAGTARALREAGYAVDAYPSAAWSSEGLLQLPAFQSVEGKKIALIRGEGGRDLFEKTLLARGGHILNVLAYQRVLPRVDRHDYLTLFKEQEIDVIVCTSFEGVQNLKILLGANAWPYIKVLPLVVVSERIKMLAEDLGFQTIWVARNASNEMIIDLLVKQSK